MARGKTYHIATQTGYITDRVTGNAEQFYSKAEARKALAEIVKDDASACRQRHKRCAVVGSVRGDGVEIKIGGRQGYHLYQRYVIGRGMR